MWYKLIRSTLILVLGLFLACSANAADLVGFWKFDGDALDSSGLGNDGTLVGDPEFVTGWLGRAVFLDGDDYVTMNGVADDVLSNNVSMSAWVKTIDAGDWFTVNDAGGGNVALFAIDNQRAAMYDGGYEGHSTTIVTDDQWHMLSYVRRGNTGYIYVDGVLENTHDPGFSLSPDNRWSIGQEWDGDTPSDFLIGTVDEARVYNGGLTDAEVLDVFNSSTTSTAAWRPQPDDGQTDVMTNVVLTWAPGLGAVSHDVYLGTNKADVTAGTSGAFQGNQTAISFNPGVLLPGATYYWRIDENAADGTVTPGAVWSFTTVEFVVVDDFEYYTDNDAAGEAIWQNWVDGYGVDENGSQVGYLDPPYAEQTTVHGGNQSMPFFYDNSTASYSEGLRTFVGDPWDFTSNGLVGMTLWYKGQPAPLGGLSYDAASQSYTVIGSGSDIGGDSDAFHYAYKSLSGAGSITVRVDSLTDTHAWARAGIMIRETLQADSLFASVVVTPSGRVAFQFRTTAALDAHSTHTATGAITVPHWIRLTRSASNLFSAEHSSDGVNWAPVKSSDPQDPSTWNVLMKSDVYIGLAVNSHVPDAACEATFSNLTITGNATPGAISQSQDVGIGSNTPDPLYVRLEDNAGTPGTIYHEAGPDAVLATDWTLWAIPLDAFQSQGVDVTAIKKIALGVGDKDDPQPGGSGMLFVDDINLVRRMPTIGKVLLFEEDFEGLTLGPNVDESLAGDEVWTKTPPAGWTIDDSGVPGAGDPANDGVTEWAGWSFADKNWWVEAAGDQQRSQFVLGNGIVAVIDPDEWDDQDHLPGLLNSFLSTPAIDVSTTEAGSGTLQLKFDSSWREEDTQTANVMVSFDGGEPVEVMRWESSGGNTGFLKPDATSETVTVNIDRPSGAKTMVVTFGMFDAGNDWWWAIDNVRVSGTPRERTVTFYEDFEGLELGQSPEEDPSSTEVWTNVPPDGWSIDNSGVPGVGNPAVDGVTDWAGWAFANKEWWIAVAGNQRRVEFELGQGTVAIADPDEWDDDAHPDGYNVAADPYDTWLSTPPIDVAGFEAGTVQLKFDSSWRPEYDSNYHQTANIMASYDSGDPIEILLWESNPTSPYFKPDTSTNETIIVDLNVPAGASSVVLTFGLFDAGNDWWWAIDNIEVSGLPRERVAVLAEDFEGLELGPNVDEELAGDEVWTKTPPAGWTIDDTGVPGAGDPANDGVTEWAGWSFTDKNWWVETAGDQNRSQFDLGTGTVAVIDPDEWDDLDHTPGLLSSYLSTPVLDISRFETGSLELMFDSSWRPEDTQTARITVQYDGGDPVQVMLWTSVSGAFFKPNATNETVTIPLDNPEGATTAVVTFGMLEAGNDWWWAIDNVVVDGFLKAEAAPILVFSEKFDGVTLTQSVDEAPPGNFWTKTPPVGWSVDDSRMPGFGDPAMDGVVEWAGWSFADKDWWVQVAGDQERSTFELGTGVVAIADPDEWDDAPHAEGTFNSFLDTNPIDISGVDAGTVEFKFDSSWRPYAEQTATVSVSIDGGDWVDILLWESDTASPNFKTDTTSETVTVPIETPAGAQSIIVSFGLFDAGNDWWWAIDNVEVTGMSGGSAVQLLMEDFEGVPLGPSIEEAPAGSFWTDVPPVGWFVDDSGVPGAGDPANDGVTEWSGWSFVNKDWWVQVAGDQGRSEFENGNAVVAVADPDEWDDLDHLPGLYNAFLSTPMFDISTYEAGTLWLVFDSSWRPEDTQTANITVQFNGGDPIEILRWESELGAPEFFKPDATNETVVVELNNPTGAQQMKITFGMLDAGNDWWWAIDNVEVISIPAE